MISFNRTILLNVRRFGHGPMQKKNMPIAIHASQRAEEKFDQTFQDCGLELELTNHDPSIIIKKSYWTKPPLKLPNLNFAVERTLVGAELPVYTDYKGGRTKVVTILRRIKGDITLLKSEMEKVVGREVTIRPGKLVVDGNMASKIRLLAFIES